MGNVVQYPGIEFTRRSRQFGRVIALWHQRIEGLKDIPGQRWKRPQLFHGVVLNIVQSIIPGPHVLINTVLQSAGAQYPVC